MQSKKIPQPFTFEVLLTQEEYGDILTALWAMTRNTGYQNSFRSKCHELAEQFERGLTK